MTEKPKEIMNTVNSPPKGVIGGAAHASEKILSENIWTRPNTTHQPQGPTPRCTHTSNYYNGRVIIFGGSDGKDMMLNEVYALNTETLRWLKIEPTAGEEPCPRAGHSACVVAGKLVVFGGMDGSNYFNDLYSLDLETFVWSKVYSTGSTPCGRSRHTATLLNDGKTMIVFGGGDFSRVYNDIYSLDCECMVWTKLTPNSSSPSPRWAHAAVLLESAAHALGLILIYGGHDGIKTRTDLHCFDAFNLTWYPISLAHDSPSSASSPPARSGHAMCKGAGNSVIIMGGGDGEKMLNDLHILESVSSTESLNINQRLFRWLHPTNPTNAPSARCAHTMTLVNESTIILFGGGTGTNRFKEVHLLDSAKLLREARTKAKSAFLSPSVPTPSSTSTQQPQQSTTTTQTSSPLQPAQTMTMKTTSPTTPNILRVRDPIHNTDIGGFLHGLGLDGYVAAFIREDITCEILPLLSERHLEAIGISSLGVRLKILGAIRKTYGHTSISSSNSTKPNSANPLTNSTPQPPSPVSFNNPSNNSSVDGNQISTLINVTERLEKATTTLSEAVLSLNETIKINQQQQLSMLRKQRAQEVQEANLLKQNQQNQQKQEKQKQPQQPQKKKKGKNQQNQQQQQITESTTTSTSSETSPTPPSTTETLMNDMTTKQEQQQLTTQSKPT